MISYAMHRNPKETHQKTRHLLLDMGSKGNLVARSHRNLLASIKSTRADVDQIDATVSHLFGQDGGLIKTPVSKEAFRSTNTL
jgi:hypothetical protein